MFNSHFAGWLFLLPRKAIRRNLNTYSICDSPRYPTKRRQRSQNHNCGFNKQYNTFARVSHFLYFSFIVPFLHDYDVKMPVEQRRNLVSLLKLGYMFRRNSTPVGFAYIWQSKWAGKIAIKSKRAQIYFFSDVLVAVASLDLKVLTEI